MNLFYIIKDFFKLISRRTLLIILLSCTSNYLCLYFGVTASLPTSLIGIAVVFPMVFSINAAYRRREEALRYFASLRGHLTALVYAGYDWGAGGSYEAGERMRHLSVALLRKVDDCFRQGKVKMEKDLSAVYDVFGEFSLYFEQLRKIGMQPTEISRMNQYLKNSIVELERMRNIALYRTPLSLRAYSRVFLHAFPIVFAPHFAHLSQSHSFSIGFLVACTYSLVLVTLDHIQEDLEDPFDKCGMDDVNLDIAPEFERIFQRDNSPQQASSA